MYHTQSLTPRDREEVLVDIGIEIVHITTLYQEKRPLFGLLYRYCAAGIRSSMTQRSDNTQRGNHMNTSDKKVPTPSTGAVALLIATRKGAWVLKSRDGRRNWELEGPAFLGHIAHHIVQDPRDRLTVLMAARTGHLGPTVFRATDGGNTWKEASKPPAFRKAAEGEKGRVVDHVFWLTPAHPSEPHAWYAGTSPQGLFRSEDAGDTWEPVRGFNDHPLRPQWCGDEAPQGTPDGSKLHSILIDPRDPNHMYLGLSSGGFFESTDKGVDWKPLNAGCRVDFLPDPIPRMDTILIACACIRSRRISCTNRIIAASTAWIAEKEAGSASARPCRRTSATLAFRWSFTRAIHRPSGYSRWTGLKCGRA